MRIFNITTYADWMLNTSIPGSIRCSTLRSLDDAIKNYETQRVEFSEREIMSESEHRSQWSVLNIRWSLEAWQKEQGPEQTWKSNERNQMQSFTKLEAAVTLHPNMANLKPSSYANNIAHTRLGLLYLLSHLTVQCKILNFVALPELKFADGQLLPTKPSYSIKLYNMLVEWVKTLAQRLLIALKTLFVKQTCRYTQNEINWSTLITIIKLLIHQAVDKLLDFPYIAETYNLMDRLILIADAAINCITTWWRARTVSILHGHPTIICNSLKSAMRGDLKGELFEAIKSSILISIMLLVPGGVATATLTDIITSIIEAVYVFLRRQMKLAIMRGIFLDARNFWLSSSMDNNLTKTFALSEGDRKPLIENNSDDFFTVFSDAMISIPELTALVLNSGICGDKMHFLNMLSMAAPDHKMTEHDKKSFQEGLVYVDDLKNYSANLLRTSPYVFDSELPDIKGYISAASEFTTKGSNSTWDDCKEIAES